MTKEDYGTLLKKIKLKEGEYEQQTLKEKEREKYEEVVQDKGLKEHIKESYKSATKKEFYNLQDTTNHEKTFAGILAYGDKLKKTLYRLIDKDSRPKDVEDKKLLEEYKSCLAVYSNALGFSDDDLKKLMMVEKRFDRLGKSILDMAEKGKLPTGYEKDYLKLAESAIKSAQKIKHELYLINQKIRK